MGRRTPAAMALSMASALASVPPLVKVTASALTPTSAATSARARSTAARASRPAAWTDDGLPPIASAQAPLPRLAGGSGPSRCSRDRPASSRGARSGLEGPADAALAKAGAEVADRRWPFRTSASETLERKSSIRRPVSSQRSWVRHRAPPLHAADQAVAARAARRAQRLVDRSDHFGDGRELRRPRQPIAAARPAGADHQTPPAQAREQLFEVGLRDLLPLGDLGERDGASLAVGRRDRSSPSPRSGLWWRAAWPSALLRLGIENSRASNVCCAKNRGLPDGPRAQQG